MSKQLHFSEVASLSKKVESPDEEESDRFIFYHTQPGDTLLKVSFSVQLSTKCIMEANNMVSSELAEGMLLKLPKDKIKPEIDVEQALGMK